METLAVSSRPLPIRRPNQSEDPGTGALFADLVSALMAPKASPPPAKTGNERAPSCCDAAPPSEADTRPARTEDSHREADPSRPARAEPPSGNAPLQDDADGTAQQAPDQQVPGASDQTSANQAAAGAAGQTVANQSVANQAITNQTGADQAMALAAPGLVALAASAAASDVRTTPTPAVSQGHFQNNPGIAEIVSGAPVLATLAKAEATAASDAIASNAVMAASGIMPADAGIAPVPMTARPDQQSQANLTRASLPAAAPSRSSADGTASMAALTPAPNALATAQAALAEDPTAAQATGSPQGNGTPDTTSGFHDAMNAARAAPQGDADLQSAQPDGLATTARTSDLTPVASSQAPAAAQGTSMAGSLRQADHAPRAIATIDQVAIHIRHAAAAGLDKIRIQLWPEHLGRVDIELEVHESGSVKATVLSDRPETLDLLQRDSRSLDRALQDAGLKTDSNSLHFASHDRSDRGQHRDPQSSGSQHAAALADSPLGEADDDPAPIVLRLNRNSLLDIQV
ncbi:MAG: flagellar hook-length control protein FliK [Alphaproteobacteria bacterium]